MKTQTKYSIIDIIIITVIANGLAILLVELNIIEGCCLVMAAIVIALIVGFMIRFVIPRN